MMEWLGRKLFGKMADGIHERIDLIRRDWGVSTEANRLSRQITNESLARIEKLLLEQQRKQVPAAVKLPEQEEEWKKDVDWSRVQGGNW